MIRDLVAIINGENTNRSDDYAYKLVYTGEDYPYSERFGDRVALFARDAVEAGMGIRTGITEIFNAHLNEVPAYGTTIGPNGHLVTNDDWGLFDGRRAAATENECYTACGYKSPNPRYAVGRCRTSRRSRCAWTGSTWFLAPAVLSQLAGHWRWVRRELGRIRRTPRMRGSRFATRKIGTGASGSGKRWKGFPYVRNLERWIVQRDVPPDGVARRGRASAQQRPGGGKRHGVRVAAHRGPRAGSRALFLDVDKRFMDPAANGPRWSSRSPIATLRAQPGAPTIALAGGATRSTPTVRGTARGSGALRPGDRGVPPPDPASTTSSRAARTSPCGRSRATSRQASCESSSSLPDGDLM